MRLRANGRLHRSRPRALVNGWRDHKGSGIFSRVEPALADHLGVSKTTEIRLVSGNTVRHVGPPDFHDGIIERVERSVDRVQVTVRGESGRRYSVTFAGASEVCAVRPEGMLLYALSALPSDDGVRRFRFTNWDDEDEAKLEIVAESARIETLAST